MQSNQHTVGHKTQMCISEKKPTRTSHTNIQERLFLYCKSRSMWLAKVPHLNAELRLILALKNQQTAMKYVSKTNL